MITITEPSGAVSTKWAESLGASLFDPKTICTVYAGPHTRVVTFKGEIMCMSGMCPPLGDPSFMRASEISQVENPASLVWILVLVDIARTACRREGV